MDLQKGDRTMTNADEIRITLYMHNLGISREEAIALMRDEEEDNLPELTTEQRKVEKEMRQADRKKETAPRKRERKLERAQNQLAKEQQDLAELDQRLTNELAIENAKLNEELRDSIQAFLKVYNKTKKYDYIFSRQGDNILLANKQFDITDEVVAGLNKRYKAKPEVKGTADSKKDNKEAEE